MNLKLFLVTALSLTVCAAPASAWWLHRKHGINRYSTVVVVRPYNAFTPACAGSLVCDGCSPFSCPQLPSGAACSPLLGNPLLAMTHHPMNINGYAQMPPMMMQQQPTMAMPGQQYQVPTPPNMQQTQAPMGYMVQPATYQQGYYPMYYQAPMTFDPYAQAPAYWYGY